MTSMIQSLPANGEQSKAARWSGRILSGFVVAFLLLDGAMKLLALPIVTQTMATLGWPATAEMARLPASSPLPAPSSTLSQERHS